MSENPPDSGVQGVEKVGEEEKRDQPLAMASSSGASSSTTVIRTEAMPEFLSSYLESKNFSISQEVMQAYSEYISRLLSKHRNSREKRFLSDYLANIHKARITGETSKKSANRKTDQNQTTSPQGGDNQAQSEGASGHDSTIDDIDSSVEDAKDHHYEQVGRNVPAIKLNELVMKPDSFDGLKPPARRWIDDYERCAKANSWSESVMVTYFPTFLKGRALDWYMALAQRKISSSSNWPEVRQVFIRHYLGEADRQYIKRQIEHCYQKEKEPVTIFIPRLLRLVMLIEPNKAEEDLVELVKDKLRSSYQEKLATHVITTLDQLNDTCLKIECGMMAARNAASRESREGRTENPRNRPDRFNKNKSKESDDSKRDNRPKGKTPVCFRCEKRGHLSTECRSKTKRDGSELNDKSTYKEVAKRLSNQKPRTNINAVREQNAPSTSTAPNAATSETPNQQVTPTNAKQETTTPAVRRLGHMCQIIKGFAPSILGQGDQLIRPIAINDVVVQALVDTGAFVSVIAQKVVEKNKWQIIPDQIELAGANGKRLTSHGFVEAKVTVKIGFHTKTATTKLAVVEDLCNEMLFGLELIKGFKICIDPCASNPIFFRKGSVSGIRAAEKKILKARAQEVVLATVDTTAQVIATIPFQFDNTVICGNSVSAVVEDRVEVLILNTGNTDIILEEGKQIALFEPIVEEDEDQSVLTTLQTVVQLADTSEVVKVGDNLSTEQVGDLNILFQKYKEAFSISGSLGLTTEFEHQIEIQENAKPIVEPMRRRPPLHVEETRRQIKEMLKQGIIEESESPWSSAYVLVKKKSGDWRLCVDFRKLNAITKKNAYPLPNIESCLDALAGKVYFSQLDFASGYWQMPIADSSKELTAFRTEDGLFQFRRMPFGLTNAPASFQKLINVLFAGLRGLNLQVFLDDVCVATSEWPEHLGLLEKVFKLVIKANLKLKGSKCVFGSHQITFLGHRLSSKGIQQDPEKLRALIQLPYPTNAVEVRRALGMFGYYRKFVPRFAIIAEPLTRLTRKNIEFTWQAEQKEAWKSIIKELKENATLTAINAEDPCILKTDACKVGVAGILLQQQQNEWRMIDCCSRRLSSSEENYAATELEGLAVVYAVSKFRHYLLGRYFRILTDHCALCSLTKKETQCARLRRWALILNEFNYDIVYTKGSLHQDVDCFSRAPVNNEHDEYLDDKLLVVTRPADTDSWLEAYDDEESQLYYNLALAGEKNCKLVNDIIYVESKLYIPANKRQQILKESHDSTIAGHGGLEATMRRMDEFWWPNMLTDVRKYVTTCANCQLRKAERSRPPGGMRMHNALEPGAEIAMDYFGPLPETLRHMKFIAVAVDVFSRFIYAQAVENETADKFARFLCDYMGRFGVPKAIRTDNARAFNNATVKEILGIFGVKHINSPPDHSRGNAVVERAIQTLQMKLTTIMADQNAALDWESSVPMAVLSMNTAVHKSTGYSPYELMFGREYGCIQPSVRSPQKTPQDLHAQIIRRQAEEVRAEVLENTLEAHERSKAYFDARHKERSYQIGDLVLAAAGRKRRAKLAPRFEGPFKVIAKDNDIYTIESLATRESRRRHTSSLKPYLERAVDNRENRPSTSSAMAISRVNLLLLMWLVMVPVDTFVMHRVPPIVWDKQSTWVEVGERIMVLEIHFIDPCYILQRFPAITPIQLHPKVINAVHNAYQVITNNVQPATVQATVPATSQATQGQPQQNMQLQQTHQVAPIQQGQLQVPPPQGPVQQVQVPNQVQSRPHQPSTPARAGETMMEVINDAFQQCSSIYRSDFLPRVAAVAAEFHKATAVDLRSPQGDIHLYPLLIGDASEPLEREKRQLGFVTGLFFSNVLSTLKDKFFTNTESTMEERTKLLDLHLNELNRKEDLEELKRRAQVEILHAYTQLTNTMADRFNMLISVYPKMGVVGSYIISKIMMKASLLEELQYSLASHKLDTVLLSRFFHSSEFLSLSPEHSRVTAVVNPAPGVLRIHIRGRERSPDTQVYRVDPIEYWTNLTTNPALMEYAGEKFLIRNVTANCIKAIRQPSTDFVSDKCDQADYEDPRLKIWNKKKTSLDLRKEEKHTTLKEGYPYNILYCYGLNITIEQETIRCPSHAFALNASVKFNTSDGIISSDIFTKVVKDKIVQVEPEIHLIHFKDQKHLIEDDNKALDRIFELTQALQTAKEQLIAGLISDKAYTWKDASYSLGGTSMLLLLAFLATLCYAVCLGRKRTDKILRSVIDGQRGAGTYDEIRKSKRSWFASRFQIVRRGYRTSRSRRPEPPARPRPPDPPAQEMTEISNLPMTNVNITVQADRSSSQTARPASAG